ncbi:MAG TPA: hypothetical protein VMJ12_15100 [Candidatus Acidoferrales bacterium]|jgi:hypothetical protein|nr:hypothetical protein [Candidatus Acidoferrales bacterium]
MNPAELHKKLISAARANPPGEGVPYAFEKRVTALLAAQPVANIPVLWVRGLWRAAIPCLAIALMLGIWAFFNPATGTGDEDLSQNFENTLLAAVDQSGQLQ